MIVPFNVVMAVLFAMTVVYSFYYRIKVSETKSDRKFEKFMDKNVIPQTFFVMGMFGLLTVL